MLGTTGRGRHNGGIGATVVYMPVAFEEWMKLDLQYIDTW
jgi:hypothetical protein